MASFTPNIAGAFAEGVTIGAYPASGWPAHILSPSGAPLGTATNTQVVTNQTVIFTGLADGVRYYAAQNTSTTRYVSFTVGEDTVGEQVTSAQIKDATIVDADLASPNNSAYKTLVDWRYGVLADTVTAGTYVMFDGMVLPTANSSPFAAVYLDPADHAVTGLTTRYRVRGVWITNTQAAPAITCTFGLYPVATAAGAADVVSMTLGTVVTGSTAAIASPAVSTRNQAVSGDFTAPAAGYYALSVVTSGTPVADSRGILLAYLQGRNT